MNMPSFCVECRYAYVVRGEPEGFRDVPCTDEYSKRKVPSLHQRSYDTQIVLIAVVECQDHLPGLQTVSINNAFIQMVHRNYFPVLPEKRYLLFEYALGHVEHLNIAVDDIFLDSVIKEDCGSLAPGSEQTLHATIPRNRTAQSQHCRSHQRPRSPSVPTKYDAAGSNGSSSWIL